jgi:pilus assembly protein Flp/PilA
MLQAFARDESGATAVEYGMIAALIAVVIIASLSLMGTKVSTKFRVLSTTVSAAGS